MLFTALESWEQDGGTEYFLVAMSKVGLTNIGNPLSSTSHLSTQKQESTCLTERSAYDRDDDTATIASIPVDHLAG